MRYFVVLSCRINYSQYNIRQNVRKTLVLFVFFLISILSNTERLPSNITYLRDQDFYKFVEQYSGMKVAELLAFQEFNAVDSFLECDDIADIFKYQSNQLTELKKKTCITLNDGSVVLLPGLKSSINNLKKLFQKKRDEINKQTKRRKYIFGSIPSTPYTSLKICTPAIPSSAQSITETSLQIPISFESFDNSSTNIQTSINTVTDQINRKVTTVIASWLIKNKQDLYLINTDIREGTDFKLELNIRQDGLIMICSCGTRNSIGQKDGTFVVRDEFI